MKISEPSGQEDPFSVLVSTVISARTKDQVTNQASKRLLLRAPDPETLATLTKESISNLIFPAGFYRIKARNLKKMAQILVDSFDSKVPPTLKNLISLPGVGRKTANLVRSRAYNLPCICVDTHVHRISNRMGWISTSTPTQTEHMLMKILPKRYWISINLLFVRFGQNICTPVSPKCSVCPISNDCKQLGVHYSR